MEEKKRESNSRQDNDSKLKGEGKGKSYSPANIHSKKNVRRESIPLFESLDELLIFKFSHLHYMTSKFNKNNFFRILFHKRKRDRN